LIICEMCGAANGELETECRICGHSLATQTEPVAATVAPPQHVAAPAAERQAPVDDSPHLQVSAVRQATPTGAPPMLGNSRQAEPLPAESEPKQALPSFMQEGARTHASAPEPVELISANDLPDWIRQIAEADAAKAAAEAAQSAQAAAAAVTDVAATRRPLPGEAPAAAGPSTSWLSKSPIAQESSDPWATTEETAGASWSAADSAAQQQAAYPTISPSWSPSAYEDPGTGKKGRFGRSQRSSSSSEPVYKNRIVQLAFLVLLLALLAAMVL
jgi:hypothetical protein